MIKGQEVKAKSRYEEDTLINNHSSVWGSWWIDGQWGYTCCHQTVKNSYCTGRAGEGAAVEAAEALQANMEAKAAEEEQRQQQQQQGVAPRLEGAKPLAGVWGSEVEEGLQLDPAKVKEALKRQQHQEEEGEGRGEKEKNDRKRRYNSLADVNVSAEEMEAYRMTKNRGDDPLDFIKKQKQGSGDAYDFV